MNPFLLATSAEVITANATIWLVVIAAVLVVVTGVYAVLAHSGNKTMKRSTQAAERSAKAATEAAVAAQRSLRLTATSLVLGNKLRRVDNTVPQSTFATKVQRQPDHAR